MNSIFYFNEEGEFVTESVKISQGAPLSDNLQRHLREDSSIRYAFIIYDEDEVDESYSLFYFPNADFEQFNYKNRKSYPQLISAWVNLMGYNLE